MLTILLSACSSQSNTEQRDQTDSDRENTSQTTKDTNPSVDTSEYSINEITFQVPDSWELKSTTDNSITFNSASNENDVLYIVCEDILSIEKIDTGDGNAILSKEDIPKHHGAPSGTIVSDEYWSKVYGFDFYEQYFSADSESNNGDTRTGRCVVIPINETEAYFYAIMMCEPNENLLSGMDTILETITGIK